MGYVPLWLTAAGEVLSPEQSCLSIQWPQLFQVITLHSGQAGPEGWVVRAGAYFGCPLILVVSWSWGIICNPDLLQVMLDLEGCPKREGLPKPEALSSLPLVRPSSSESLS